MSSIEFDLVDVRFRLAGAVDAVMARTALATLRMISQRHDVGGLIVTRSVDFRCGIKPGL